MSTVHREQGFKVRIYPANHLPPHVHVVKAGTAVKITLGDEHSGPQIVAVYSMSAQDVLRAFRLVERYQERIFRLCAGIVGMSSAEDAAQEAFLKAYKNLSRFRGESKFSTWLYRIASNHCLDMVKKNKSSKEESLEKLNSEQGDSSALFAVKGSFTASLENRETVRALLNNLSADERMILVLREQEGLSYQELAETLEISLDAVKVRLFRAREALLNEAKSRLLVE